MPENPNLSAEDERPDEEDDFELDEEFVPYFSEIVLPAQTPKRIIRIPGRIVRQNDGKDGADA